MLLQCHLFSITVDLGKVSAMALLFLIQRHALAATMRQTVVARTKKFIRPALLALVTVVTLSATVNTIRSRKRQALDATSEWGRYASNPAARGRAVMVIFLRLLPYWARQQFVNAKRKSELKTKGGAIFADSLLLLGPLYFKLGQILSCRDNLLPPRVDRCRGTSARQGPRQEWTRSA